MAKSKVLGLLFLLLFPCILSFGQSSPATGAPPFSTIQAGFDSIDLANLNIHFKIPIRQRASATLPFSYNLSYDSLIWFSASGSVNPTNLFGWRGDTEAGSGYISYSIITSQCPNLKPRRLYTRLAYHDAHGSVHYFGITPTSCDAPITYPATLTDDGSGLSIIAAFDANAVFSATIESRSGTSIAAPLGFATGNSTITDANGNQLSASSVSGTTTFTDTLGTATPVLKISGTNPVLYTYAGPSGNVSITKNYSTQTVKTSFGCSGMTDFPATSESLPSSLVLPSSQGQYTFTYEQITGGTNGRIKSVRLPTGGTISYAYSGGNSGMNCVDQTTNTLTRTTPDGVWTYVHTPPVSGSTISTTTVTDPLGNKTVYTFSGAALGVSGQYEVQRLVYSGSSTLLSTITTCYNTVCSPTAAVNLPITQKDVYTTLTGQTVSSLVETLYNNYGLVTRENRYKQNTSATLFQQNIITYGSWNGSSCVALGNYIADHPCMTQIFDGGTNLQAETTFAYDANGNTTQVNHWTGSVWLTTNIVPNGNGTLNHSVSPSGDTATFGYGCNGQVVNSVSHSTGNLSASGVLNCDGAAAMSATDANGQPTTYGFASDPFWRVTSSTDPLTNTTNITYSPTDVVSILNFGSSTISHETDFDGLGRPYNFQTQQGPSSTNWDTTTTYFDAMGRPNYNTFPCVAFDNSICANAAQGQPGITTLYDALGRVTSVSDGHGDSTTYTYTAATNGTITNILDVLISGAGKTTQLEYSSTGNLTSVCEVSSQSGSGSCGQQVAKSGFVTYYGYDPLGRLTSAVQGVQTRTFTYDMLGRLLSENNPENGLTQYFYDTAPSTPGVACAGTFNGSLVKEYDANGNTTCFTHDGLGRVLSVSYSGPNDSGTNKYFVHDGATVNGQVMANSEGRLSEAYTATSQTGTKITDEGFSYGVRGELADVYQSTPNSGGYYHTTAAYFANGAISSLSGIPGQATWTFGVDGKGRPQTATWGTTAEVTNTTYDAADRPLVVTLGLGDTDTNVWDGNTGHLSSWTFSLGATPTTLKGTLGYSGTTGLPTSLNIVDGFNSVNSQNCTYGYDDIARTNNVGCGTDWAQTFSYDRFGNVTKNGSISWNPGYTSGTNRYQGASTYDANGNLKFDTFHNYTWNTDNKAVTIDGTTITYDAFNNPVEKTVSGVTTEILYTPLGKTATMSGQSVVKFFMPLAGGESFEYITAGPYKLFHHHDGLGSSRFVSKRDLRTSYYDVSYAPFGEDYNGSGSSAELNFTGRRQDLVAGTYDFPAREFNPRQGRWISPDPAGIDAMDPSNPQSWNRYAYVLNNPLSYTDPLGLECVWDDGSFDSRDDPKTGNASGCGNAGGTWFDPSDFANRGLGDWNPNGNTDLEQEIANMQGGDPNMPTFQMQGVAFADVGGVTMRANNGGLLGYLASKPWMVSWILPVIGPVPGVVGVGPAGGVAWNPQTHNLCVGAGLGASAGHNAAIGPLLTSSGNVDSILSGWSVSGGGNLPFPSPAAGLGWQVIANSSGVAQGPTAGVAGLSGAVTWSACAHF